MKTMSNVDIFTVCYELNELLKGARVDKSFQPTKDTVIMRFHVAGTGRVDVVFQAGIRTHTTQYPLDNPTIPPSFPMLLRKKLKGANVVSIKQHHFDRIIEITMQKAETYTLIIELFSKGNIILLDQDKNIISPLKRKHWSDRDISSKKEYKYPPKKGINPLEVEKEELKELLKNSEEDLVRTLAKNGFGSVYSEEIILKTNIDKKTPSSQLTDDEIVIVYESLINTFEPLKKHEFKPNIILEDKKLVEDKKFENDEKNNENEEDNEDNEKNNEDKDKIAEKDVLPIDLKLYTEYKKEYFDNFNHAADEFFSEKVKKVITSEQETTWNKKVKKYSKRLKLQTDTLDGFGKTIEVSKKKGELLYTNYSQVENILNVIHNARLKEYSWIEIGRIFKKARKDSIGDAKIVESVDKLGNVVLDIEDIKIAIDSKKSIPENAELFYEKAKKAKRKIKGAKIAIENTKKQLAEMEAKKEIAMKKIMVPQKRIKKELKWFEKLRWFLSSDDHLVIGGRDANTNETIVRKYLDNNDIYLHADIHGAPSIAIKTQGDEIDENTLKESCVFAASFSTAWSKGYGTQDVYWVHPDQVSKTPESGEFVAKGAFIIRGKRNYIRGSNLKIAIGIVDYEGPRIMAGPIDAIKKHCEEYVIIKPGYDKKEKIAKEILHKINKDNILTLDDVVRVLPSGKCEIVKEPTYKKRINK
ncbi:ribosome rescue protein RqcH [Methanobrevibacter filiformis]|uniref:Archaeal Rqc2 homolog aRqcH n=1 Tax=Methanobrevibacter filiformis TaxID=55758 RepID=A0A162FJ10_9EURY|nr:ribosome rescue protein RqcH [Methanobrevibacter filiformis]KZX10710.1 hypothetical protein MBFIL_16220 [Methanobrevibacter filiformis]